MTPSGSMSLVSSCSGSPGAVPAGESDSLQTAQRVRERVPIKQFSDLVPGSSSAIYDPSNLAVGPDGALWVTNNTDQDSGESAVVRISTSGTRTNTYFFSGVTSQGSYLDDITTGPDGALWVTDGYNEEILRLSVQGKYTRFPLGSYGSPSGIVTGPDKALWFTENFGAKADVVKMTTKGKLTPYATTGELIDIASGSDGALWFTDFGGNHIGRITTTGKITEYSKGISAGAQPFSIAPGPDGALWFTELAGRIGRITTGGKVTKYSNGITQTEMPQDLVAGPDGAMWITEFGSGSGSTGAKIGRTTMQGKITEYSKIDPASGPSGITKGLKGDLWFGEGSTNEVGRLRIR
jgi:virginiamycin B lyase